MIIDISQKLSESAEAKIKIAEGKEYNVDCGAETMLVAEQMFSKNLGLEGFYKIIVLFIGDEALKEIKKMNLTVKKLQTVVIAIMAQANEISFEEMEKRFQEQSK